MPSQCSATIAIAQTTSSAIGRKARGRGEPRPVSFQWLRISLSTSISGFGHFAPLFSARLDCACAGGSLELYMFHSFEELLERASSLLERLSRIGLAWVFHLLTASLEGRDQASAPATAIPPTDLATVPASELELPQSYGADHQQLGLA